jgi:hypothetical protein
MRTVATCGLVTGLLASLTAAASAQSSCSAENSLCLSRGGGARCAERMDKCKRTGCWEHIPKYGGRLCSLKKS